MHYVDPGNDTDTDTGNGDPPPKDTPDDPAGGEPK